MIRLTKIERLQLETMRQEISPWGLATALEIGGKHLILKVWARDGGQHRLVISCTPRCDEQTLTISRQRARRLIRLINSRETEGAAACRR